jgi:hypothetical protein
MRGILERSQDFSGCTQGTDANFGCTSVMGRSKAGRRSTSRAWPGSVVSIFCCAYLRKSSRASSSDTVRTKVLKKNLNGLSSKGLMRVLVFISASPILGDSPARSQFECDEWRWCQKVPNFVHFRASSCINVHVEKSPSQPLSMRFSATSSVNLPTSKKCIA